MLKPSGEVVFSAAAIEDLAATLRQLLADVLALHMKTKGFHWHVTGRNFRDDHQLLDEQAGQIFEMVDVIAERTRTLGARTLRSISDISRLQTVMNDDRDDLSAIEMFAELLADNRRLTVSLRAAHELCDEHRDIATASLIENWIDEAERRIWFLTETCSDRWCSNLVKTEIQVHGGGGKQCNVAELWKDNDRLKSANADHQAHVRDLERQMAAVTSHISSGYACDPAG